MTTLRTESRTLPGEASATVPSDRRPAADGEPTLVNQLRDGRKKVGIWGLGYLGYHNLVRLLMRRIGCVVTDDDPRRMERVGARGFVEEVLSNYHGFGTSPSGGTVGGVETCDASTLARRADVGVHLICVPNERQGQLSDEPVLELVEKLAGGGLAADPDPVVVAIELSAAPGVIDRVVLKVLQQAGLTVGRQVCVGSAPRMDYGRSPFETRVGSVRLVGGVTGRCGQLLAAFYRLMGEDVRLASSHREAELACLVHRGGQHLLTSYANQLALAFGETDMREVMTLAAAVGGLSLGRPGLGSGGYFLPVSAHHLRESACDPDMLTLVDEAFRTDLMMAGVVADRVLGAGVQRLAILGVSAQADVKYHAHTPTLKLTRSLRDRLETIAVCDPLYSDAEITAITHCEPLRWPAGLERCDGVVVATGHHVFRVAPRAELADRLGGMKLVLDAGGTWADKALARAGVNYFALGQPGW